MIKRLSLATWLTLSLFFGCSSINNNYHGDSFEHILPRTSFLFLQRRADAFICVNNLCAPVRSQASASGFIVGHSENGSFGITAEHFCSFNIPEEIQSSVQHLKVAYRATTIDGIKYDMHILRKDIENDICFFYIDKLIENPAVVVSPAPPLPFSRVYNIAAINGIFTPGMVPVFEGFFNGTDSLIRWSFYSIPVEPGSSGSMLVNWRGELVGMIHSRHKETSMIAMGPDYRFLREFIAFSLQDFSEYSPPVSAKQPLSSILLDGFCSVYGELQADPISLPSL